MNRGRGPPEGWAHVYRRAKPEDLPWFSPDPDPDLMDLFRRYPPGRALDMGCGPGIHSIALAGLGWRVTALDISPDAIGMASRFASEAGVKVDFKVMDVLIYEPDPGSFDLVHDRGFLHSLGPDRWAAWTDLAADALLSGGIVIAKEFMKDTGRHYGPEGFSKSELRNIFDERFHIEKLEKGHFPGTDPQHYALLVIARRV